MLLTDKKKQLIRWLTWFSVANILLFWILGIRYLTVISLFDRVALTLRGHIIQGIFLSLAYIGQFALLSFLISLPLYLITIIFSNRTMVKIAAVILFTLAVITLIIDSYVFQLYRFHLQGVIITMIFGGQFKGIFDFSWLEYLIFAAIIACILLMEIIFAYLTWHYFIIKQKCIGYGKWLAVLFSLSLYTSCLIIISSANYTIGRFLIDTARALPLYPNILSYLVPKYYSGIWLERAGEVFLYQPKQIERPLNYPKHPLACTPPKKPLNLIMITIDTWRPGIITPSVTPNIYRFSKKSWVFENHWSGGNATRPGIFTLFYGIPGTYWTAFETMQRQPVLMDELLQQHYQMGIFASAELEIPAFNKTVFANIRNLRIHTPGKDPVERDKHITKDAIQFIHAAKKKSAPFYLFLFYDAVHGFCYDTIPKGPFKPAIKNCLRFGLSNSADPVPYLNRYKNALHFVDNQIEQVFKVLSNKHLLNNTVILITGDHGQEFNDNHLGYWGHASNFTYYQAQTPLILYWPQSHPHVFQHTTSHYDIAPTFMHRLLGCHNPANDYSLGTDLLKPTKPKYLIISSYIDFGIVTDNRIITVLPSGSYRIDYSNGKPIPNAQLDLDLMQQIFTDLTQFYKK